MTDSEYEEAYREALLCIWGAKIEEPQINADGERFCCVNEMALTDIQVFEFAWGPRIADQIKGERNLLSNY